jgi:hypothetical protein
MNREEQLNEETAPDEMSVGEAERGGEVSRREDAAQDVELQDDTAGHSG